MYRNILLPIDLNEDSSWSAALPIALEHCRTFGSALHVATVVPSLAMGVKAYLPEDAGEKLVERADAALAAFVENHVPKDIGADRAVGQGTVYHVILDIANEVGADLIIMAAHRPALGDFLLGPNTAKVVRHGRCSVLVVRG